MITTEKRKILRGRVKEAAEAGLSCRELASQIGISATTVYRWTNGKYPHDDKRIVEKVSRWAHARVATPSPDDELRERLHSLESRLRRVEAKLAKVGAL